jgi:DNA helicase-2/ATP-dependent DNA helicase PcrA
LDEIDPTLIKREKCEESSTSLLSSGPVHEKHEIAVRDKEYIRHLFLEQGFSVSALNNYLTCPWRYFFSNLIRIPSIQERHQLYGTAIHETLKVFFDAYKEEREMTKKEFIGIFESFLNRKALSTSDYELFLEKGTESLGGYYDAYKGTWEKNIFNEFNVSGVHLRVDLGESGAEKVVAGDVVDSVDILLRGQLDKVELLDGSHVNVVDYKTGNPKSRNDIEGETKTSEGNYKRQLVFYKILLDGFDEGKYQMKTGEIDFVEPNKQGKYKKERFDVTDEEVAELNEVIKKAAREILSGSFWNDGCNEADCEYCNMRRLLIEE